MVIKLILVCVNVNVVTEIGITKSFWMHFLNTLMPFSLNEKNIVLLSINPAHCCFVYLNCILSFILSMKCTDVCVRK